MDAEAKKKNALAYFVDELLARAKARIVKIIVFGSFAKGTARPESDVDVLVVFHGDEKELIDLVSELSFDAALLYGESIEPFLMSLYEFRAKKHSFFITEVVESGQELYEMGDEAYVLEAQGYVDLADEFLTYARDAVERNELRPALDEGYNAVELLLKALILAKGKSLASSHGGIVQQFGQLYVVEGELEKEIGKRVRRALTLRNKARYDPHADLKEEDARAILELGAQLIGVIGAILTAGR